MLGEVGLSKSWFFEYILKNLTPNLTPNHESKSVCE